MSKPAGTARAALMGLLFAIVGFSYAVATSSNSVTPDGADARVVGSALPLDFANAFVPGSTDRDLGDVAASGTKSLTRFVRAKGGLAPYTFTAGSLSSFSGGTLQLLPNGLLTLAGTGTTAGLAPLASPFRFSVTVTDSTLGSTVSDTETFRLTIVQSNQFRFAVDNLGDAVQRQVFTAKIDVINPPAGTVVFAATAGSAKFNGTAIADLGAVGLALASDGTVFGKPTRAGVVTFTATAAVNTTTAANRDGSSTPQTITVNVVGNDLASSFFEPTKLTIKTSAAGKESISLAGNINLNGQTPATLSGKSLAVKVGGVNIPTTGLTFDAKGKLTSAKGTKTNVLKVSISTKGQFKLAFSKATIASALGTITGSVTSIGVSVQVGDGPIGSQVVSATVKGAAPKQTISYSIGKSPAPGGAFIVTGVAGKDAKDGSGTAYKVDFLALSYVDSANANLSFATATKASVSIGNFLQQNIAVTPKGSGVSAKGDKKQPQVSSLKADGTKGKGQIQTGPLPAATTGIPLAGSTSTFVKFPFGLQLLTAANANVFAGQTATQIKGTGKGAYTGAPK